MVPGRALTGPGHKACLGLSRACYKHAETYGQRPIFHIISKLNSLGVCDGCPVVLGYIVLAGPLCVYVGP